MAKINMVCPFEDRLCNECPLYRGRHYYLCFCRKYRGYISQSEEPVKSNFAQQSVDSQTWARLGQLWGGNHPEAEPKLRLKVIDMESGKVRFCELEEAKTWDWSNPEILRVVNGVQLTSWERLAELASFRAKKGYHEVEVYEAPRFILLGGG